MPFEMTDTTQCTCTNVNVRRELHGEEHVPAMDLSMRLEGGNELLNLLDPNIRTSLCFNASAEQGQETIPGAIAVLPNLRMPKLNDGAFKWNKSEKHKGYRLVVDWGLGDEQGNVDLDDCTVSGWSFELKEGGSCVLHWKVSYAGEKLTQEVRGKLTGLTDELIFVQIIAPPVLQIVKGKGKVSPGPGAEDDTDSLIEDDDSDGLPDGSPEAAFAATGA